MADGALFVRSDQKSRTGESMSKRILLFAAVLINLALALPSISSAQLVSENIMFSLNYMETGRWGPRDGSRTGLFLEIQRGRMAGILAVYDEFGEPRWFSFSGEFGLTELPGEDRLRPGIVARLWEFSGGGCIVPDSACIPGQSSDFQGAESPYWITMQSLGRSLASYRIWHNDVLIPPPGPLPPMPPRPPQPTQLLFGPKYIVPLTFGVTESAENPNDPLLRVADLEGVWLVSRLEVTDDFESSFPPFDLPEPLPDLYTGASILRLGEREIERFEIDAPAPDDVIAEVRHAVIDDPGQLFLPGTVLVCPFNFEHTIPQNPARCNFREPGPPVPNQDKPRTLFQVISDSRARFFEITQQFTGGPLDAVRLDFFRLNHD